MIDDISAIARVLGVAMTAGQAASLARYVELLQRWNTTYNLTALRTPGDVLSHHIADCLAVMPALMRQRAGGRLLDVGSGGGLPGVVISIMAPSFDVTCVDAVGKKAAFVRQVAGELALPNLHALHSRVENMAGATFDVVASRAFASLADFVSLTRSQPATGGIWMAMKGKVPDEEIAGLPPLAEMFHVEPIAVPGLAARRCIVWMKPRVPAAG